MGSPTDKKRRTFVFLTIVSLAFSEELNKAPKCHRHDLHAFREHAMNEHDPPEGVVGPEKNWFSKPKPQPEINANSIASMESQDNSQDEGLLARNDGTTFESRRYHPEPFSGRGTGDSADWSNFEFDRYLRYDEIIAFVKHLISNNSNVELFQTGTTSQGRPIIAVKIGLSPNNPTVVIDGGIHPREWAATMSTLYIIQKIIQNPSSYRKLTYYVVPATNPDGYEYTHTTDRLWRKTMSKNPDNPSCAGADANRNFDSHWNEFGTDNDPCVETYAGREIFSEPEARAIRDMILAVKPVMYLTFHTFGGLILYPWGFSYDLPPNWRELSTLGKLAAAAVEKKFHTKYTVGSSTRVLYSASGGSDDWAMQKAGVRLVYTIELEDYGTQFELPPSMLPEIVRHAYTIFAVFVEYVENLVEVKL